MQRKTWPQWLKDKYKVGTQLKIVHKRECPNLKGAICTVMKVNSKGVIIADYYGKEVEINISTDEFDVI